MRCLSKSPLCIAHHLGGIFPEVPRIHSFIITLELPLDPQASFTSGRRLLRGSPRSLLSALLVSVLALFLSSSVSLGTLLNISKPVSSFDKWGSWEVKGDKVIGCSFTEHLLYGRAPDSVGKDRQMENCNTRGKSNDKRRRESCGKQRTVPR